MTISEYFSSPDRSISALIMLAIIVGVALRKNRRVHPTIMTLCFLADLGLLAWIELSREAIATATDAMTPMLALHIVLAVAMLVLYVMLTVSGVKILKGDVTCRRKHLTLGVIFLAVRVLVMTTAVLVANEVKQTAEVAA